MKEYIYIYQNKAAAKLRETRMTLDGFTDIVMSEAKYLKLDTIGMSTKQTTTIFDEGRSFYVLKGVDPD